MATQAQPIAEPGVIDDRALRRRRPGWLELLVRLTREKPLGLIGGLLVLLLVVTAFVGPYLPNIDSNPTARGQIEDRLVGPSVSHPMGTDQLARDVLTRVVWGAQTSLVIGLLAVVTATVLSMAIGVTSGYFGGKIDLFFQRIIDGFIAFPALVVLLAVVAMFRNSSIPGLPANGLFQSQNVILFITLGAVIGVSSSRVMRGAALSVREMTFIEAGRSIGVADGRMIMRHVVPNVMAPVITLATLGLGNAILIEASLSFLGLGVGPDTPTWGGMLNREARTYMTQGWWLAVFPGLALTLAVFGFNMFGDALRDLLDPRLRTQ